MTLVPSRLLPVSALALALASCAGADDVQRSAVYDRPLAQRGLEYAAAHGPVLVEIVGDPFAQGERARDGDVLPALRRAIGGTGITLTTDPAAAGRSDLRLVVLLEPETVPFEAAVCTELDGVATGPVAGTLQTVAVFCDGATPLGLADGAAAVTGPEDEAYARLLRRTAEALFPELHRARVDRYYRDRPYYPPVTFGLGVGVRL